MPVAAVAAAAVCRVLLCRRHVGLQYQVVGATCPGLCLPAEMRGCTAISECQTRPRNYTMAVVIWSLGGFGRITKHERLIRSCFGIGVVSELLILCAALYSVWPLLRRNHVRYVCVCVCVRVCLCVS